MRIVKPQNSFLEIGPGDLDLAMNIINKFNNGTVIDFNSIETQKKYINLPENIQRRLTLIIADFMKYDLKNRKFNCIISCDVMEHIENDDNFINRIHNLLMDNGQLILSVPARKKYWAYDDELVGHYRRYEKDEIKTILENSGFSKIKIYSYGYPFTNIIRYFRIKFAKNKYQEKSNGSKRKRSQRSAFLVNKETNFKFLALIINKYTLFPFILFSLIFNNLNLGEGYIIAAQKE